MNVLFRPYLTRVVGGVCAAISERFGTHVWIVRAVLLTAIVAAPIVLLFYLIAWLSIPGEVRAVRYLRLAEASESEAVQFSKMSSLLLRRTGLVKAQAYGPKQSVAFLLLLAAFVLQMPKVEGQNFFYLHPLLAGVLGELTRFSGAIFYLVLAFGFLLSSAVVQAPVVLPMRPSSDVQLDRDPERELWGLASGLARVLNIQPSVIRLLFVFLNVMTFGVVGLIYITLVWLLRRQGRIRAEEADASESGTASDSPTRSVLSMGVRVLLGSLFLLLAAIRISTELRLFFFNEPFFQGIVLAIAGFFTAISALRSSEKGSRENILIIVGTAVMLTGVYELSTTLFRVQLALDSRFLVGYLTVGLGFLYYSLVLLRGNALRVGLGIVALLFLAAAFVEFNIAPARALLALVEFYDFFYPVLLAGFGFWLIMER